MEKTDCEALRREIKTIAEKVFELCRLSDDQGDAHANAVLAYRHLEDASMRLGKAIQALDGSTSIYDKWMA